VEQDNQDKEKTTLLLDQYLDQEDQVLVQRIQMGSAESFIGSVTLEWLNRRVRFAAELPLFHQKFDQSGNVIRDAETIEEIQQRPLDWSRQLPLTQYLSARKTHKFPAVLVVISPSWVDNPQAEEWDNQGEARKSAAKFTPLDKNENFGLLDVSQNFAVFALDGQHRLMGIQGLMELIKTGKIQRYNKNKKPVGDGITVAQLAQEFEIESSYLSSLAEEKIGIEFIPAAIAGETRAEAKRRIRSIFIHVNLMAVRLSAGQLAMLNEDDGFSIVARKIAVSHPLLKEMAGRKDRVNWDSATIATKSTVLTTLQALQDMSERYLAPKFPSWKSADKKNLIPMRPVEEELEAGIAAFRQVFDDLATLVSYQRLDGGEKTPALRRFSFEQDKEYPRGGEANILFRPVGQVAVMQALGILVFKKGFALKSIFEKLRKYDADGGFSGMENYQSLWYGVLYDPMRRRVMVSGRDLASKLLIYILGGIADDLERAQLRQDLAKARQVAENKAMGFHGKFVTLKEVGLPSVLN